MGDDAGQGLLEQIGAMRGVGTPSARRLAEVITREPMRAAGCGIVELAQVSGTSLGSVNRFCRSLGLDGYTALRLRLAQEVGGAATHTEGLDPSSEIDPATTTADAVQIIAGASRAAITHTAELLDIALLDRLAEAVEGARLVQIIAYGGSAHVASYLASQLTGIGITCLTDADVNTAGSYLAVLGREDVVVALSHSGMARHAVEMVEAARAQGVLTAAITSSAASPLAQVAEISLVTTARSDMSRYRGTAGRHAQLYVADTLYVCVAQRRHEYAQGALDRAGSLTAPYQIDPAEARRGQARRRRGAGSVPSTPSPTKEQ